MIRHYSARGVRWLNDLPSRLALRAANQRQVRQYLGRRYRSALADYRQKLPTVTGNDARIVGALEREGVFVTSLAELQLPGSEAMLNAAALLAREFAGEARRLSAAGQLFTIVPPAAILAHPQIFGWGLHDRVLNIAEAYIGLPPAYDGVALNYTVADGREVSTRLWHRDWEDRRMLKIAVYLHNVGDSDGPFQMVARRQAEQSDCLGYRYDLVSDAELSVRLGPSIADDIVSCTGARGTVIFTDTARFYHRGKPAVAQDRAALFYSFIARPPRHPFLCQRTGIPAADVRALAATLPQRQRAAALWRREVHPLLRLIPPAAI